MIFFFYNWLFPRHVRWHFKKKKQNEGKQFNVKEIAECGEEKIMLQGRKAAGAMKGLMSKEV